MLEREVARAKLNELEVPNWVDKRLHAFRQLSPSRETVEKLLSGVLSLSAPRLNIWGFDPLQTQDAREKEERMATEILEGMSETELRQLFKGIFPHMVLQAERAWEMLRVMPYQADFGARMGFRAPHTPQVTAITRLRWLRYTAELLARYECDIEWTAAWAGYMNPGAYGCNYINVLLAAALDIGDASSDRVLEILMASARGEHEIGGMGYHVVQSLLMCSRPDAWEFVEKMLLAAQREEGLRHAILETVDFAHPMAMQRILRLILEHDLLRFSATVRSLDSWFGFAWDSAGGRALRPMIESALEYLESSEARTRAMASNDPQSIYLALWAEGQEDVESAVVKAVALLDACEPERRFVVAYFLASTDLASANPLITRLLDDEDPRIPAFILQRGKGLHTDPTQRKNNIAVLERLLARAPEKPSTPKPIVWPWCLYSLKKQDVCAEMFRCVRNTAPQYMIQHLPHMESFTRELLAESLGKQKDAASRAALLSLAGDASARVRDEAIKGLQKSTTLAPSEAETIESYLTRKAGDLRRGVLTLLMKQEDRAVFASADRLLAAKKESQRAAGLELLRLMIDAERSVDAARERMQAHEQKAGSLSKQERVHVEASLGEGAAETRDWTFENALGLMDFSRLTPPPVLRTERPRGDFNAASACISTIDALVHEHREKHITLRDATHPAMDSYLAPGDAAEVQGREVLLSEARWNFPEPVPAKSPEDLAVQMPLREIWEAWYENRGDDQRDDDGLEVVRAALLVPSTMEYSRNKLRVDDTLKNAFGDAKPARCRYGHQTAGILHWLMCVYSPAGVADYLLEVLEAMFAHAPKLVIVKGPNAWSGVSSINTCVRLVRTLRVIRSDCWSSDHEARFYSLLHWSMRRLHEELKPQSLTPSAENGFATGYFGALLATIDEMTRAFATGAINSDDFLSYAFTLQGWRGTQLPVLAQLTKRKNDAVFREAPGLKELADRLRERILEIELKRGDMATPASLPTRFLSSISGAKNALRVLETLGSGALTRGYMFDNESRECVSSHLLRVSHPSEDDTPESFAKLAHEMGFKPKRLIEMAVYAAQWARFVEHALAMPGMEEAVWWVYAHTKGNDWSVAEEIRKSWAA
ncbi:MAG: DUF5724 domain-containing protein, partial [Candidatus Hydrogenedentales bacterium]